MSADKKTRKVPAAELAEVRALIRAVALEFNALPEKAKCEPGTLDRIIAKHKRRAARKAGGGEGRR